MLPSNIANLDSLIQIKPTEKSQSDKNLHQSNLSQRNGELNRILGALPATELEFLSEHLELILLPVGKMLYEPGEKLQHVYFPTTCIVSLHHVLASGGSVEIAGIGNEGMVGVTLIMGSNTMFISATVQISGYAYKLNANVLLQEFNCNAKMQHLLLRYTQKLMIQIGQAAACNRHHNIRQQLSRWLLLTLDRLPNDEMTVTQELMAFTLGVRRESVTEAAGILQREGLISYRRGHITVINRAELEHQACECYFVIRNELRRCY